MDLRDGNQALIEPMDSARKQRMFDTLVAIGFKQIEVGFPSASQTNFDFVRQLIDSNSIPDDVTIQVLTQAREDLIERTFEALRGAPRAILHFYHATAPVMRRVAFNKSRSDVIQDLAVHHARLIQTFAAHHADTYWTLQYSPEMFSNTELDFSRDIVDAVTEVWAPSASAKCIINLPSTVETCTPNTFADMVEWMHDNIARRDAVVLSVHPHNDRGTGTAAAEMALMAGADRLEGCLFGNGERTGNLDIVNVALNLYTQGTHPGLDLSNIDEIRSTVEFCNQLPVHPRHPYVGDLVYTSFSGSHQDAIKKALSAGGANDIWDVPYLPLDPADLGRSYQAVIRVNSQSGKGGITYLLESTYGIYLPRRAQIEFSQEVQKVMDALGGELVPADIWRVFEQSYLHKAGALQRMNERNLSDPSSNSVAISTQFQLSGDIHQAHGTGESAAHAYLAAISPALGATASIAASDQHSVAMDAATGIAYYVELRTADGHSSFGVGVESDELSAAAAAVCSAVSRLGIAVPALDTA